MNPYDSVSVVPPPQRTVLPLKLPSRKRIAWNTGLAFIACILIADSYSRFMPSLTRVLTSRFDDIYAVADIAQLANLATPFFLLFALTTVFFSKRGVVLRLALLFPVLPILLHHIPPRIVDVVSLAFYLAFASSILTTGQGWPVFARHYFQRICRSPIPEPDDG